MSQPSLRGRVVLKFPANVVAGYGIIIDKTNSTYTFSVDPSILEGLGGGGEGGGIPEAPNDGQQYGRQSLAWTVIAGGGVGGTLNLRGAPKVDDYAKRLAKWYDAAPAAVPPFVIGS